MINRLAIPLVCILGIQAGYVIAQTTDASSSLPDPPSVTKELPSSVAGLFLFNNQPQAWQQVSQFFPVPPGFAAPGFLPHIPPEINFATEIKPWVGDWTANVLMPSSDSNRDKKLADRTLTLVPVTDASLLPRFIEQVGQQRFEPPMEREYQGVKILVWPEKIIPQSEIKPPLPREPIEPQSQSQMNLASIANSGQDLSLVQNIKNNLDRIQTRWQSNWKFLKSHLPGTANKTLIVQTPIEEMPPSGSRADPENSFPEQTSQVIPGLAIAVVPGYMAAARSAAPIEQWIESRNQGISLAENANFQRTLANPDFGRSLLVGYGQIAELAKSLFNQELDLTARAFPLPIPDSQQLQNSLGLLAQTYSSGEVLVWFQEEGLRSQSRIYYQTPLSPSAINPVSNTIYSQIPAATYLSISGQNLNQLFLGIFRGLLNQPAIAQLWATLGNTTDTRGGDIAPNMIPWIDGEYALFIFPTTGGLFPAFDQKLQLGIGMIIETSDRTAATEALQRLDQWAVRSSEENIILKQDSLNGQPVTQWQVFNPQRQSMESLLSYSWLDNQTLIVASGLDPLKELHPQPYLSLNQSFTFTTATNPLPPANNGYFYLNFGSLLSLINNFLNTAEINNNPILMLGRRILGNIRSITLSTSTTTINTQADFFIVLSPRSRTP